MQTRGSSWNIQGVWGSTVQSERVIGLELPLRFYVTVSLMTACVLSPLGCKKGDATQSQEAAPQGDPVQSGAHPSPGVATPPPAPASRLDEESFQLSIQPSGALQAGKPGAVDIVLVPKTGYKCNDKYPYKFKAKQSDGVTYASDVVTRDAMTVDKHQSVMKVAFTPQSAGKKTVAGQFAFSVCTEERCLVERRDLTVDVDVQ